MKKRAQSIINVLLPIFFLIIISSGCQVESKSSKEIETQSPLDSIEKNWDNYGASGFKQHLIKKGIPLESVSQNEFEALQKGNLYSNFWLNFSIDLPDSWAVDRGVSENTVIRSFQRDSAMTFSVNVIPWLESVNLSPGSNPNTMTYYNKSSGGSYENLMIQLLEKKAGIKPIGFEMSEKSIGLNQFVLISYKTKHIENNEEYYMKTSIYQMNKFRMTYTLSFSSPDFLYDEKIAIDIIRSFRASTPKVN